MSMFAHQAEFIESSENRALYRFSPDLLHAPNARGVVEVSHLDWTYILIEASNGEELGAVSSDIGCLRRLIPRIKESYNSENSWPLKCWFTA